MPVSPRGSLRLQRDYPAGRTILLQSRQLISPVSRAETVETAAISRAHRKTQQPAARLNLGAQLVLANKVADLGKLSRADDLRDGVALAAQHHVAPGFGCAPGKDSCAADVERLPVGVAEGEVAGRFR